MRSAERSSGTPADRPGRAGWTSSLAALFAVAMSLWAAFAAILLVVAGFHQPPAVDLAVLHSLQRHRTSFLTTFFTVVTTIGSPVGLAITMTLVAGGLGLLRTSWLPIIVGAATLVGAELLGSVLKILIGRARPVVIDRVPGVSALGLDFPSGHSTQSAAAYTAIALLVGHPLARRGQRIPIYLAAAVAAALVGVSRLYLGVHWFTDVVASWLLGVAWALLVWVVVRLQSSRISPSERYDAESGPK